MNQFHGFLIMEAVLSAAQELLLTHSWFWQQRRPTRDLESMRTEWTERFSSACLPLMSHLMWIL